jgi:hypothetical protein
LLLSKRLARTTIHGPEAKDILVPESRDRTFDRHCRTHALADFTGHVVSKLRIGRLLHQVKRLDNQVSRNDSEKW